MTATPCPNAPLARSICAPVGDPGVAHQAADLAGDVDPGRLAVAEPRPHVVQDRGRFLGRPAERERDLRGDHVARVGDAILERHPAHALAVGVVDLGLAAVEAQRAGVLDPGRRGHGALRQRGGRGHHLEHRARLVDGRHDRVDEPRRLRRGDRLVVVAVVRGIGRHRVDLAGVRIHDDGRHALGLVGDPGGEQLLLDPELEAGVDGQREVRPGGARLLDRGVVEDRQAARVAFGDDDARLAGELCLVFLLDAVLARHRRG